ncbi:RNA-directed DNA polymerase from mobile element jockey [Eumeta japonica]|uniref:RNA-directed DNA polymerase from mobile element jockey n=1 Tax=Eumeta variegata TaxID=151549 RepID=A0A4C1YH92_EUMVA|nr:RNA-directed DNA polymerase from mobile element jockey [Eumeta japonica]
MRLDCVREEQNPKIKKLNVWHSGTAALLTYSSDFGAARLDPCELRTIVPYTCMLSEHSAELHEGYTPIPPLKRPNGSIALDDAECIADSIETQCSHVSPPQDIAHINSIEEELALFAYDTALFFRSRTRRSIFFHLPRAIDELGQWSRKWRIEVNPNKSAAIQFTYSKNRSKLVVDWNTPNLKMLNARIPWQRSYKYLGVTLDKNLHFREHIARIRKNALFYTARLGAMLGRKSKLSWRNKRTLYKMCIRTVTTYACPVFAHAAPKGLHKLQVIQNKFCRAATDAHWCVRNSILHRDLELPTLSKYMRSFTRRSSINHRIPPTLSVGHGTY